MNPINKHLLNKLFLCFLVTLFGILLRGYSYGLGDQVIHLPLLAKLQDSTLYPGDYLFPAVYSNKTIIYNFILFIAHWFQYDFFILYFVMFIFGSFVFYLGIYALAYSLFKNQRIAVVSLFISLISYPIAGSAISTVESGFVPRIFAHALLLFLLNAFFHRRWMHVVVLFGAIFIVHPLTAAVYGLVIFPMTLRQIKSVRRKFLAGGIAFSFGLLLVWSKLSSVKDVVLPIVAEKWWVDIVRFRNPYAFPTDWPQLSWIYFILSLLPLGYYFFRHKIKSTREIWVYHIFLTSTVLMILQVILTSIIPIAAIILLQLGRIWFVLTVISFIYLASEIIKVTEKLNISFKKILLVAVVLICGILFFRKSDTLKFQNAYWIASQVWAREHTSKNCTFLVNFYSQGFRFYSQRSIVGEYKDGTISLYSKKFAKTWNDKRLFITMDEVGNFIAPLQTINERYPFSFVVINKGLPISWERVYENENYSIHKNPQPEPGCKIFV